MQEGKLPKPLLLEVDMLISWLIHNEVNMDNQKQDYKDKKALKQEFGTSIFNQCISEREGSKKTVLAKTITTQNKINHKTHQAKCYHFRHNPMYNRLIGHFKNRMNSKHA
jgi:hypothetical protein